MLARTRTTRIVIAAGLLGVLPALAQQQQGPPAAGAARVSAERLEVRTGPGTRFDAWQALDRGAAVEVLERRGDWARIRVPGWVDDRYVQVAPGGGSGEVTSEALNVRAAPAGRVMQWLAKGDRVAVRGHRGHWMQIDSHGFVDARGLEPATPAETAPQEPPPPVTPVEDEGLPLDLEPQVVQVIEPAPPLPTESLPLPQTLELAPISSTVPTPVPPTQVTDAEVHGSGQELAHVAPAVDGPTAWRLIRGVPALSRAFDPELTRGGGEAFAGALLPELLLGERAALQARYGARFRSPAEQDQAIAELRLRASEDERLAASLAGCSGQAPRCADPLLGTWSLRGKQGAARLILAPGEGDDLAVRREELGPDGAVVAVKRGFARLKGDELEVTYAESRGALEQLQSLYRDVGTVVTPGGQYELDLRSGRIRGRHYPRGQAVEDPGQKEEGWRADRVEPVSGVYDLQPGYLIGKDPIELQVTARPDGRYDLVRTTRKGPRQVEILEGEGTLEGRELKASFGGGYRLREDGRIEGRVAGHTWGESGWKRSAVPPLAGSYLLQPTWYAFGKKPPIALRLDERAEGGLTVTRQAEGQPVQQGRATVKGRALEVVFQDGSRGRYEVGEDGKIEGSHQASARAEAKSEGGWREELHLDPEWLDTALRGPVQSGGK